MNTLVVTNLIMALAISTTTHIPTACPDNLPGCLVYHTKPSTSTEYIPAKAPEDGKGLAYPFLVLKTELINSYGSIDNLPDLIPIYLYLKNDTSVTYPLHNHPCGFIHKDMLLSINSFCKLDQSEKHMYINTNNFPRIPIPTTPTTPTTPSLSTPPTP